MNTQEETILVIGSALDASIRRWLHRALTSYQLVLVEGYEQVWEAVPQLDIDLIVLRLDEDEQAAHLVDDIALLRQCAKVPVIVLSQVDDEHDAACILDAGADDYVRLPVGSAELYARCRALLRRVALQRSRVLQEVSYPSWLHSQDDFLRLYVDQRQVYAGSQQVRLARKEFDLLQYMMLYAGKILPHCRLLRAVWGPEYSGQANLLRVYILQLRRKVEQEPRLPRYIHTKAGIGYGFQLV